MCPRYYNYTTLLREDIGSVDMTLSSAKNILQHSLLSNIKLIHFCGNYGDAIVNKDFIPIVKYIRSINPNIHITLSTNGGARDKKFWTDIAHLVDKCDFGIDGLRDTNHLYRQFVNWDLLERNVKTYTEESIKLGKRNHSAWIMNVFRHNKHQINEAKSLSKEWNVTTFSQRLTDRFSTMGKNGVTNWPVYDKNLNLTHVIYPSENDNNDISHDLMETSMKLVKKITRPTRFEISSDDYKSLENRYGNDKISCKVNSGKKSIYIDYKGRLYPCCYIASTINLPGDSKGQQLIQMYEQFGKDFNDLNINSIENIFESGIFEEIEISWYKKSISCGKTAVCIAKCGINSHKSALI